MAVEIRELVIKATVVKDDEYKERSVRTEDERMQLIQDCVKEVLRIMAKNKSR